MLKISGFQPYGLKDGPHRWDAIKNRVSDGRLAVLSAVSPTSCPARQRPFPCAAPAAAG
jgi:hypothetical protein